MGLTFGLQKQRQEAGLGSFGSRDQGHSVSRESARRACISSTFAHGLSSPCVCSGKNPLGHYRTVLQQLRKCTAKIEKMCRYVTAVPGPPTTCHELCKRLHHTPTLSCRGLGRIVILSPANAPMYGVAIYSRGRCVCTRILQGQRAPGQAFGRSVASFTPPPAKAPDAKAGAPATKVG